MKIEKLVENLRIDGQKQVKDCIENAISICKKSGYDMPYDINFLEERNDSEFGRLNIENKTYTIYLNSIILESPEDLLNTLLHELGHYIDVYIHLQNGDFIFRENGAISVTREYVENPHTQSWNKIVSSLQWAIPTKIEEISEKRLQDINTEKYISSMNYVFRCPKCNNIEGFLSWDTVCELINLGFIKCGKCNKTLDLIKGKYKNK